MPNARHDMQVSPQPSMFPLEQHRTTAQSMQTLHSRHWNLMLPSVIPEPGSTSVYPRPDRLSLLPSSAKQASGSYSEEVGGCQEERRRAGRGENSMTPKRGVECSGTM